MQDRLKAGRGRLEAAREALTLLCEPVQPPKGELQHIHYFCGNTEVPADLAQHEPQRVALYKAVAALVRAYASISDNLPDAGYSPAETKAIEQELTRAVALRAVIRQASGETLDLKAYEADMRHLIDTYIKAEEARTISDFGEMGLIDVIVKSGIAAAIASLPRGVQANRGAVAETIANNVRSKILREHLHDPAFYDKMSRLLSEVLADLKAKRIDYEEFLKRWQRWLSRCRPGKPTTPRSRCAEAPDCERSTTRSSPRRQRVWRSGRPRRRDVCMRNPALGRAQRIDASLRGSAPNGWRGFLPKEQEVKRLIYEVVQDTALVERLFAVIKVQAEY